MGVRNAVIAGAAFAAFCGTGAAMSFSEAGAPPGGRTAVRPSVSPAGIGIPRTVLPVARRFAAASAPPTSADCVAAYGIACYCPLRVEQFLVPETRLTWVTGTEIRSG